MKILYVTSEALPYASTGGLADVLGALPVAVKKNLPDSEVAVIMPLYKQIKEKYMSELEYLGYTYVGLGWRNNYCGFFRTMKGKVAYYFVDNEYYFLRDTLYGSYDDGERFAFFSKCAMEFISWMDFYPDILHCNDWQTALCSIYLKRKYGLMDGYRDIRCVFTIHNVGYMGQFPKGIIGDVFDLPDSESSIVEMDDCINLMKGAIVTCDRLTTVSRSYAEELKYSYYSKELCPLICENEYKLKGIINGIDTKYYNPGTDEVLVAKYTASRPQGKAKDREKLLEDCGFAPTDAPVIACVSRLTPSKGFDLVRAKAEELLWDDVRLVILGTGDYDLEEYFKYLESCHSDKVKVFLKYDKDLSKEIYAGADLFLMPSLTEPCGLSQMIAARYGTPPIVRETGGLKDSIIPFNEYTLEGNGFSFANYNADEMLATIRYALYIMRDPDKKKAIVKNAMKSDFSWDVSAKEYIELYKSMK